MVLFADIALMNEKIKKYETDLTQKEAELKEAAVEQHAFKDMGVELQNSCANMEGK